MNAYCRAEFADDTRWDSKSRAVLKPRIQISGDFAQGWGLPRPSDLTRRINRPGRAYSMRSLKLAQLRADAAAFHKFDAEELTPPAPVVMQTAEAFINGLSDGCLDFNLEISHDGEINFLYGQGARIFHIYIDDKGLLSYYSKEAGSEKFGDEIPAANFPYGTLQNFVHSQG